MTDDRQTVLRRNRKGMLFVVILLLLQTRSFRVGLLVVEHDVGKPDLLGGNVETIDTVVNVWIPDQLVVKPFLRSKHRR